MAAKRLFGQTCYQMRYIRLSFFTAPHTISQMLKPCCRLADVNSRRSRMAICSSLAMLGRAKARHLSSCKLSTRCRKYFSTAASAGVRSSSLIFFHPMFLNVA